MKTQTYVHEVLYRGKPDGTFTGHVQRNERYFGDDGNMLFEKPLPPEPLAGAGPELEQVMGDVLAAALRAADQARAEAAEARAECAAHCAEKDRAMATVLAAHQSLAALVPA